MKQKNSRLIKESTKEGKSRVKVGRRSWISLQEFFVRREIWHAGFIAILQCPTIADFYLLCGEFRTKHLR